MDARILRLAKFLGLPCRSTLYLSIDRGYCVLEEYAGLRPQRVYLPVKWDEMNCPLLDLRTRLLALCEERLGLPAWPAQSHRAFAFDPYA